MADREKGLMVMAENTRITEAIMARVPGAVPKELQRPKAYKAFVPVVSSQGEP